ncbi:MAG: lytic murein transglycosylase [Pseudolabrys sp.]|nr:lytic murein transglycosylase [Pseudolabrys sp.]
MILRALHLVALVAATLVWPAVASAQNKSSSVDFQAFVRSLWPEAQAKGITRATFDQAFSGLSADQRVINAIHRQPEYGRPVGVYVNGIASAANIANGKRKAEEWKQTFDAVERQFGVDRWVLLAIWGMETSYGAMKDKWDVFRSLGTLAAIRFRDPYFRKETVVALKIMQDDRVPRAQMVSSWAGAMGQTQFMPTNVIDYAIDFNKDGKIDIWNSVPDVLGSTGNYLHKQKWVMGLPWGFEVLVPPGFDYRKSRASFADWSKLGVRRADGAAYPARGDGILFFPSGAKGPGFIVTENFAVLKEYNNSDAYAIAVGHLADRIRGAAPFRTAWPADDVQLPRDARVALQKKLAALGYKVNEFDAHIDFDLRDNIRAEQVKFGMLPDGHPTAALLDKLGIPVR